MGNIIEPKGDIIGHYEPLFNVLDREFFTCVKEMEDSEIYFYGDPEDPFDDRVQLYFRDDIIHNSDRFFFIRFVGKGLNREMFFKENKYPDLGDKIEDYPRQENDDRFTNINFYEVYPKDEMGVGLFLTKNMNIVGVDSNASILTYRNTAPWLFRKEDDKYELASHHQNVVDNIYPKEPIDTGKAYNILLKDIDEIKKGMKHSN
ncbi:MAG: hypothetical protein ABEK36_02640 [Candidatus Aenigmatarchaeota archaeon]